MKRERTGKGSRHVVPAFLRAETDLRQRGSLTNDYVIQVWNMQRACADPGQEMRVIIPALLLAQGVKWQRHNTIRVHVVCDERVRKKLSKRFGQLLLAFVFQGVDGAAQRASIEMGVTQTSEPYAMILADGAGGSGR